MRVPAFIASFLLLCIAAPAFAAGVSSEPVKPVVLQNLEKQGVTLKYLGNDNGVDGWAGFQNGQEQYFYATPDGQAVISGIMMNAKGDIVTMRQIQELQKRDPSVLKLSDAPPADQTSPAPQAAPSAIAPPQTKPPVASSPAPSQPGAGKAQSLWADIEASNFVAVGQKTAPVIYAIIDPQCPHCHDMIDDIRKSGALDKGLLQLRLIPVGLMNPDSLTMSANLLTDANPAAALFRQLDGDRAALMTNPKPDTGKVQANMALMQKWNLDVTPFTVYKDKSGAIKILRGRPKDLKSLLAELK